MLAELLQELDAIEEQLTAVIPARNRDLLWTFILHFLRKTQVVETKPEDSLTQYGWLELLWNPAPAVAVLGMNEGKLSNASTDSFLPDVLAAELGLLTQTDRYAQDAYVFWALNSSRPNRVFSWFAVANDAGDPMKPAQLLFHGEREALPEKINAWFDASVEVPSASLGRWKGEWSLIESAEPVEKISITQFGTFLNCPFQYYLQKRLKMEELSTSTGNECAEVWYAAS